MSAINNKLLNNIKTIQKTLRDKIEWNDKEEILSSLYELIDYLEPNVKFPQKELPDNLFIKLNELLQHIIDTLLGLSANRTDSLLAKLDSIVMDTGHLAHKLFRLDDDMFLISKSQVDQFKHDIKYLDEHNNRLKKEIENQKNYFDEQNTRHVKDLKYYKNLIDERVGLLDSKSSEIQNASLEFKRELRDSIERQDLKFNNFIREKRGDIERNQGDWDSHFKLLAEQVDDRLTSYWTKIDQVENKIEDLFGLVGKSTLSKYHKDYADISKKNADRFLYCGIGLMIIAFIIMIATLFYFENVDSKTMFLRVSISIMLILPAIYLISESRIHRTVEHKFRDLEIKMAAITPFFQDISDGSLVDGCSFPEKDKIKMKLAEELLAPSNFKSNKDDNIKDVLKVIKQLLKN